MSPIRRDEVKIRKTCNRDIWKKSQKHLLQLHNQDNRTWTIHKQYRKLDSRVSFSGKNPNPMRVSRFIHINQVPPFWGHDTLILSLNSSIWKTNERDEWNEPTAKIMKLNELMVKDGKVVLQFTIFQKRNKQLRVNAIELVLTRISGHLWIYSVRIDALVSGDWNH